MDQAEIKRVLSSTGPVVKVVVLRAVPKDGKDSHPQAICPEEKEKASKLAHEAVAKVSPTKKPAATADNDEKAGEEDSNPAAAKSSEETTNGEEDSGAHQPHHHHHKKLLTHLMEEIEIDTTPSKSMVAKTLGGPFTFLGQYEDEGIVLMIRKPEEYDEQPSKEDLEPLSLKELKQLAAHRNLSLEGIVEKSEVLDALLKDMELPPINPHQLQPPLHKRSVRGDILVLKVAATEEELDQPDAPKVQIAMPTNEEFFLDYSLEQYLKFAARTDIPEHEIDEGESEDEDDEEESGDEGEEDGEGFVLGEDGEIDDEDKSAMFNLVMNEVLRQYREDNGRGPNTQELLELRSQIAKQLDVDVAEIDAADADWDKKAKEGAPDTPAGDKKIAFSKKTEVVEYVPDPNEHDHHDAESDDEDDEDYQEEGEKQESEPPQKKAKLNGNDEKNGGDGNDDEKKPAAE